MILFDLFSLVCLSLDDCFMIKGSMNIDCCDRICFLLHCSQTPRAFQVCIRSCDLIFMSFFLKFLCFIIIVWVICIDFS